MAINHFNQSSILLQLWGRLHIVMCSPALGAQLDACLSMGGRQIEISPYGQGEAKK